MKLCECDLWWQDVHSAYKHVPDLSPLEGKSVLVTGAGGLVCSAMVDLLLFHNENTPGKPIRVLAAGRHPNDLATRFGRFVKREFFDLVKFDASKPCESINVDYIVHGASNADPHSIVREPVETMLSNVLGLHGLLRAAQYCGARRVLFVSSSEIYGWRESGGSWQEEDCGYVDLLSARSSYPIGKRAAETLCASFFAEYGVDTVIVRPGHIYGPTASKSDSRVSSAWAWTAARGEDLVMKSDGNQIRSYVHCLDCATAMLTVLLKGKSSCSYNVANSESVLSIAQMGEIVAHAGGVALKRQAATAKEQRGFNPMGDSSLNSSRLESLGWCGHFDAYEGLERTVRILRCLLES